MSTLALATAGASEAGQHRLTGLEQQATAHFDVLFRTALRLTANRQDAEDLVQETYLRALRFFDRFRPGTNLRAWLLKILTNTHLDGRRALARTPRLISLEIEEEDSTRASAPALVDGRPGVEEQVLAAAESERLRSVLAALPGQFREAVQLSDIEEWSYDEIASATGVGRSTVGSRVFRGRALLRERLAQQAS